MKILLDSSYFFPLIQIQIQKTFSSLISYLIDKKSVKLYYSIITLFELSAKGAILINRGKLVKKDVVEGINALRSWKEVIPVDPWLGEVQRLAFDFRTKHKDYVDCLILACAVIHADILICEDQSIQELGQSICNHLISELNPNFTIWDARKTKAEFNSVNLK